MTHNASAITLETASLDDCPALAVMNRQLIDDEGNGNTMAVSELECRMRDWFQKGIYTGYLFKRNGETIGYALVDPSDMWMRHFFICRECRRKGYGRAAVGLLFEQLGVEEIGLSCLMYNSPGLAFWRSFDHEAYSIKFNIRKPNIKRVTAKPVKQEVKVIIREIEEKDYLALLPLWNNELGNPVNADNTALHYDRIKDDERYKTFVALIEDEVVGFVSSVQSFAIGFEGSFMQITGIAVKKEMQHKGIGTKLLLHMKDYARANGVYNIGLNSGYKRTAAHAFYQRNGYSSGNWCFGKML